MKVHIRKAAIETDECLDEHARRRSHFVFGRFAHTIQRISIAVTDINGPRGGQDKQCKVTVYPKRGKTLFAQARHEHEHGAVAEAMTKCGRALARRMDRSRPTLLRARLRLASL